MKLGTREAFAACLVFASLAIGLFGSKSTRRREVDAGPLQPTAASDAPHAAITPSVQQNAAPAPALVALGRAIFFDAKLSTPRGTSCASCHDPAHGFAGNHGSSRGVARGSRPGHFAQRNTPSVRYLKFVRPFHFRWEDEARAPDATGGFFWDGRSDSIAALVAQPLLNANEMGNPNAQAIAAKLRKARYAREFVAQFGAIDDADRALLQLGRAVEAFLTSDEMAPFSSRYDDFIRGRGTLSALELTGLALFKNPAKGNCASCHKLHDRSPDPTRSLFTDYGFEVVGVPRNRAIPDTSDAAYVDRGLCARSGAAVAKLDARFCAAFRTPSLRNVALRERYMHNGVFSKLRDVVAFYATRDSEPERWYPSGVAYDDMLENDRKFVNVKVAPYDRQRGQEPRLNERDIDAIVAFLGTLSDAPQPRH